MRRAARAGAAARRPRRGPRREEGGVPIAFPQHAPPGLQPFLFLAIPLKQIIRPIHNLRLHFRFLTGARRFEELVGIAAQSPPPELQRLERGGIVGRHDAGRGAGVQQHQIFEMDERFPFASSQAQASP